MPPVGEIPLKNGKVNLTLDQFITQLYQKNRGIAIIDANHGDPATPNFLAKTSSAMAKAGAARHFDEFTSSNQKFVDAYFKAEAGSDEEKTALARLKREYTKILNPIPLNVDKDRSVDEYMEYYISAKKEGRLPVNMDAPSLPDLVTEANTLKEAIDQANKDLNKIDRAKDAYKAKKAEIDKLNERYEPVKAFPKLFKEIISAPRDKQGGLIREARFEVQKVWTRTMKESLKPDEKFSVSAGREHFEGGNFKKDIVRDVTGDKGTATVLVIQAPVLRDTIYPGKKENIPFPASPGELPDYVVVTPSVLLMDALKTDKTYQSQPQKRKEELAERYEQAGKSMSTILHLVRDKQNDAFANEKDPEKLAKMVAPYAKLEKAMYSELYLELSRGQITDARATVEDMRAWVQAQKTFDEADKKTLLQQFDTMAETLKDVNDKDTGIKGVPTPADYAPSRMMGKQISAIAPTNKNGVYNFTVSDETGETRKYEVEAQDANATRAIITRISDVTDPKAPKVLLDPTTGGKPITVTHIKGDNTYLKGYNNSAEFQKLLSGSGKEPDKKPEEKKPEEKMPDGLTLSSPMAGEVAWSSTQPSASADSRLQVISSSVLAALPKAGKDSSLAV